MDRCPSGGSSTQMSGRPLRRWGLMCPEDVPRPHGAGLTQCGPRGAGGGGPDGCGEWLLPVSFPDLPQVTGAGAGGGEGVRGGRGRSGLRP